MAGYVSLCTSPRFCWWSLQKGCQQHPQILPESANLELRITFSSAGNNSQDNWLKIIKPQKANIRFVLQVSTPHMLSSLQGLQRTSCMYFSSLRLAIAASVPLCCSSHKSKAERKLVSIVMGWSIFKFIIIWLHAKPHDWNSLPLCTSHGINLHITYIPEYPLKVLAQRIPNSVVGKAVSKKILVGLRIRLFNCQKNQICLMTL
jgi:hypothetical protein